MKIGFFVSGKLGLIVLKEIAQIYSPIFIATEHKSIEIIEWAENNKVNIFIGNPRNNRLKNYLGDASFDIGLSVNYLFLIEHDIISKFKYPVNFHGSLLPKYRGRTPHVWAIINNESITGITAHLIDNGCDTGPIIAQVIIPIEHEMSGGDLLQKFTEVYPSFVLDIVQMIEKGNLVTYAQDEKYATYFGKRTPEDGLIDWNWSKERIFNWVRAQMFPYPGAYTFYNGERIIIDKLSFSDQGFHYETPNGTILNVDSSGFPIVKTPNGSISIIKIRGEKTSFIPNTRFYDHN
jgi:methionyl-tRNA formyltransferase